MGKAKRQKQENQQTIDAEEVEKFSKIADEWWDENGKFRPLHLLNPFRLKYIREKLVAHFGVDAEKLRPLEGLDILDIGCGGGLVSIPVSRMGGNVLGVDASEKNVKVAQTYADKHGETAKFQNTTVEELAKGKKKFDVILNLEVAEHVADVELFIESCAKLLKKNGVMVLTTINRTPKSYLFAIVGAEYILRILPKGTHEWKKFLKPSEVNSIAEDNNLKAREIVGVKFNPVKEEFSLVKDLGVNYMMTFEKV